MRIGSCGKESLSGYRAAAMKRKTLRYRIKSDLNALFHGRWKRIGGRQAAKDGRHEFQAD
jgi:hypothetical protein